VYRDGFFRTGRSVHIGPRLAATQAGAAEMTGAIGLRDLMAVLAKTSADVCFEAARAIRGFPGRCRRTGTS
jgi:hypothetical protein